MAIMKQHCERGYEIVRKIPFLREAAEIVYAHQERFDGTGYPRGLRGEQIPLGARIFAIADSSRRDDLRPPLSQGNNLRRGQGGDRSLLWKTIRSKDRRSLSRHAR